MVYRDIKMKKLRSPEEVIDVLKKFFMGEYEVDTTVCIEKVVDQYNGWNIRIWKVIK